MPVNINAIIHIRFQDILESLSQIYIINILMSYYYFMLSYRIIL